MTVFYDARWKDELLRLEGDLEVERDHNQQLEQQIKLRDKAIEKVAELHKETKPMYKLTQMVLDIATGTKAQEPAKGRKQQEPGGLPGLLNVFMNNLDQPTDTDTKRQAIHDNQWKTATFNHLGALTAQLDAQEKERARRAEAERLERERLERERAKVDAGRHIYGVGS